MATAPHTLPDDPLSVRRDRPRRRLPAQTPRLSVIVVNYHQWENTAALTRQLRACRPLRAGAAEVVIVDNHSPPHPLLARLRRWPGVSLRRWGCNRGFARAVNEGCRLARGEWLLLLNPDMTVGDGFLDGVLALADRLGATEPGTGIVGFSLRNSDGSLQLSAGLFPTLARTLAGLALPRARRKYHPIAAGRRCQVEWVTGCCLLIRRDCLDSLGGLDEDFFLYYEDVDLCRRARAVGWSVWHEPGQAAVHHHPLHARAVSPALRLITRHSLLTYAGKHWPGWQMRLLAMVVRVEAWARRLATRWRRDEPAADLFGELGALAADLARGHAHRARRRLRQVARREELRHWAAREKQAAAAAGTTHSSPAEPAPCLLPTGP
jgi:GT2 family glycosyltransferase